MKEKPTKQQILAGIFIAVFIIVFFIFLVFILPYWMNKSDIEEYNNGICEKCGGHYHLLNISNGYVYYTCDMCEYTICLTHQIYKSE